MTSTGKVYLVGAGPGDPDLLTVKALKVLQAADVVVYDRLVSPEIIKLIPAGIMLIGVGKSARNHTIPQSEINEMLVALARKGRTVVRLKGGDPFIFGRGSEEAQVLFEADIPFDVVPGMTSAQGCSAFSRIPLTHRGLATSVRYITGHCREDRELNLDWQGLVDPDTTLVVYMGLANIVQITDQLIAHGMPTETPAAAIMNGTIPEGKIYFSSVRNLPSLVRDEGLKPPVLFIIGAVVDVAKTLGVRSDASRSDDIMRIG